MVQFIEVTDNKDGRRIAINVETIRQVVEREDGCFIITVEEVKKGITGWGVKESYHTVMAMLTGKI